jgi:hypothetical protein
MLAGIISISTTRFKTSIPSYNWWWALRWISVSIKHQSHQCSPTDQNLDSLQSTSVKSKGQYWVAITYHPREFDEPKSRSSTALTTENRISNGLRKPNLFRLTNYMLKCVERLHHDLELTSDVCLSGLVNAQRLEDELFDICAAEFVDEHRLLNLSRIKISLMELRKETSRNGNQRREYCPRTPAQRHNHVLPVPTILLRYSEMVLFNFRPQAEGMAVLNSDLHSKEELEAVRSTVEAGRAVLDTLVDCPVSEYSSISFVEWMRLPQVISTLTKDLLLADSSASKSRIAEIRDHVRLDLYLESLCYRMQTLTTFKPPEQPRVDFWVAMRVVLDKMREFYVRHMRQRTFGGRSERGPEVIDQNNWRNNSTNVSTITLCLPDESSAPQISVRSEGLTPETADQSIPELPDMEFSLDEFLQMEFWGGSASYDPTIERNEWGDV